MHNTALGYHTLFSNTTGTENTATGNEALSSNSTGLYNTANGHRALYSNTTGLTNTANGDGALYSNTTGNFNTANGGAALGSNTTGQHNTAIGAGALGSNTTGADNTAVGDIALSGNTIGVYNTASGFAALSGNTTGTENAANGAFALFLNTTGNFNTAIGVTALDHNTTGSGNTASGVGALYINTTGNGNIALGNFAGSNLTTGNNNIDIGNQGVAGETGTIRIGAGGVQTATFIAGIANAAVAGSAVYIDTTSGQLGLVSSSERFKDGIEPMGNASEALLSLRPVTFHYKKNIDPKGAPQFGLVAEEVEKVNPGLVVRDAEGKVFTVRYEAVNAMLLNEFLKEHRAVQELKSTAAKQEGTITKQQKQIEALTTGLQKVSDQLELSKPVSQIVGNNR
jgi:Chaperone of endosialidase